MEKIVRNFLEIKSLSELSEINKPKENIKIEPVVPKDFQLNKFLYKQIGKKYYWVDRLDWSDQQWSTYVSRNDLYTYILKVQDEIAGFFEIIYHVDKSETEITYLGLFENFFGKKLGGYLLSEAIKISWNLNIKRVWVHTCSLDHKNALNNYLARGMKIYNCEIIN
jgi:ribosomal protein S18 acetylase RimI-like enzyme